MTTPPGAAGARAPCRGCGRTVAVPDLASLGLAAAAAPPPVAHAPGASAPPPAAGPGVPAETHALPTFGTDRRLDLRELERHAARLGALSWIAGGAGLASAAATSLLPALTPAERLLAVSGCLLLGLLAATGLSGARAAALAAVALAQRQREILRSVASS